MKRWCFIAGLTAVAALPSMPGSAVAQELSIQPRATLGYQYYKFDGDDGDSGQLGNFDIETDYLLGGLGVTAQYGRFFVDLYGQTNLTEGEDFVQNADGTQDFDIDATIDRYEVNLALGYAIIPTVSVIGGLKYARTDIQSALVSDDAALSIILGDNSSFDVDVEYVGPFFGAAYALPVQDFGSLVVSGSLTYLFGETTVDSQVGGVVVVDNQNIKGESIGSNVGVAWSGGLGLLSSNLAKVGYSVGLDYSQYQFEDDGVDEFAEKTIRGKFDLKYRF